MGLPLLGGAEGAYLVIKKLATGANVFTLSDYGLAYDATTNPRGINAADDYDVWSEAFGTSLEFATATIDGVKKIDKTATTFTLTAAAGYNDLYAQVWIIPRGGVMRTVI
mgnify:CR=1 FL=1